MEIKEEEVRKWSELFRDIEYLIGNEGVEIVSDDFAFFNPVKIGRDLQKIKQNMVKIEKFAVDLLQENKKLQDEIKNSLKKDMKEIIPLDLGGFAIEMYQIIEEKKDKHKDAWKNINLDNLRDLLDEKITHWRSHRQVIHYSREKRLLLHIANYCYFLHCRILELDKK